MSDTITDTELKELFGGKVKTGGNNKSHYVSNCFYCNKSNHFYINRKTQLWDCKKCGEEGNIVKLLHFLGKLFLLGDFKSIDRNKLTLLSDYKSEDEDDEEIVLDPEVRMLPKKFYTVDDDEYLSSRGFGADILKKYGIGYCKDPKLKDYVIIPIYEKNECRGYLGRLNWDRSKIERMKSKGFKKIIRWKNDDGAKFSHLLFGFNEITENTKTVILLEGVPDKISLDIILGLDDQEEIKCCATFGKKISRTQIMKLLSKGVERVILIFDEDAIGEMKKYGKIISQFFNVNITFTYNKDINDSSESEVLEIFDRLHDVHYFDRKFVKRL